MENYNENELLKRMARQYAEHYGGLLVAENAELERQGFAPATPWLDKKVSRIGKTHSLRRYAGGLSALAAAVLIALMIPRLLSLYENGITAPDAAATAAPSLSAPSPAAESAAPAAPSQAPREDSAPELLPLTFALPDNFSVADSELDNGKSVYYLADTGLDDVVMTMELDSGGDAFAGLTPVDINGGTVYYKYTRDFSVMAFEKSGITYVLTCKYDVNTLVPLAEAIL